MATTAPPMEIVTDILLRLPIKDILRYKCVAKAWCNLISSSHFAKLHLTRTLQRVSESGSRSRPALKRSIVLSGGDSLQVVDFDSLNRICKLDYPRGFVPDAFLVGSCDGLICMCSVERLDMALFSPTTRTSRLVCRAELPPHTDSKCFGFGYDSRSDDYKIILISCSLPREHASSLVLKREIRVYSLRTNSWRLLSEEPSEEEVKSHGAFANGKMHWISIKRGREDKGQLLSFDIEEERLGEVPMPPYYGGQVHHPKQVAAMEGNLCFLTEANRGGLFVYIDVWMMKEYGVANSWIKLYSVWCLSLPYPVASLRNGDEVLVCEDGNLFWYNRYEQRKNRAEVHGADAFSEAIVSVDSLMPVTSNDRRG